MAHRVHQHLEHIGVVQHGLLQAGDLGFGLHAVLGVEVVQALELALLFFVG